MIAEMGGRLSTLAERWVPDPFVLAIGLTAVVSLVALPRLGWDPLALVDVWVQGKGGGKGLWNLLSFSMQMCLILVTGHALAETPVVARLIGGLARLPRTPRATVAMVSITAMLAGWFNWGLGLIVGALLAKEVGRLARDEGRALHYPLVVAAGYAGLMVWHGGFSGSAPLKVTTEEGLADVLPADLAARVQAMPLQQTLGSTTNLMVVALCLVVVPLIFAAMTPERAQCEPAPEGLTGPAPTPVVHTESPAAWLEHSRLVVLVPVALGAAWLGRWVWTTGLGKLDPNVMNLFMLTLGLLLHGSVKAYLGAVERAVRSCAGIILQFPFYAGIMGIMAGSGLVESISASLAGLGPLSLSAATFYLGGLVNLFVPSGGGQWAVQGPIVLDAALQAGLPPEKAVLALAYGDQWTNMVQPFWALPLLGICQVRASAIIGYTTLMMLLAQFCFLIPLFVT